MRRALGYAAKKAKAALTSFPFERGDPRPTDMVFDVLYFGVCHSDLHKVNNEWNNSNYPLVPGHEITGRVTSVGAKVSRFRGDAVGVGCIVGSCRVLGVHGRPGDVLRERHDILRRS
jgi:alcohol dehydrogenase (NADP+)